MGSDQARLTKRRTHLGDGSGIRVRPRLELMNGVGGKDPLKIRRQFRVFHLLPRGFFGGLRQHGQPDSRLLEPPQGLRHVRERRQAAHPRQNVLGRPGDAADVQTFVAVLDAGNSRSALLAGFADSDEARGRLNGNPNVAYAATAEAQVARVYDTAFGRDADPAGFNLFTQAVINGTSLQQVALSFLASPEFTNRYGASPSDQALVDGLYQNTLQRAPDAAGEALFVQALASGLSRVDLLVSFSDSQEHINLVAQRAGARDAAGYNVDLQPHLGIIPVVSARATM